MEGIDTERVARMPVAEFIREYPDESQRSSIENAIQQWSRRNPELQALWDAVRELRKEIASIQSKRRME
jgi:polyhydroxyalkanoate synthesis regulator phasin